MTRGESVIALLEHVAAHHGGKGPLLQHGVIPECHVDVNHDEENKAPGEHVVNVAHRGESPQEVLDGPEDRVDPSGETCVVARPQLFRLSKTRFHQ